MSLTIKQQEFINEYLQCMNGVQAARRAGYKGNYNTLGVVAYENLNKPKIKKEIERRLKESAMSADEVIARLARQARANMADFVNVNSASDLKDHPLSDVVKKIKVNRSYDEDGNKTAERIELELYDAHASLVDLGKFHAMFIDRVEHNWKDNLPDDIEPSDVVEQFSAMLQIMASNG